MLNKLWFKLTIAFLLIAIVGVVIVAVLANRATSASFNRFLEEENSAEVALLRDELVGYYREWDSWAGVETLLRQYRSGMGSGIGLVLIDGDGRTVAVAGSGRGNRPRATDQAQGISIQLGGQEVGQLLVEGPPGQMLSGRAGQQFLSEVNEAILLAGVIAVTLALVLGVFLARGLTRPLGKLTEATRSVAAGDLDQQVQVSSGDELGELADSFNLMAAALAANERQRQQLFADVAHELRTPLSVIRGQLEAMLDGCLLRVRTRRRRAKPLRDRNSVRR